MESANDFAVGARGLAVTVNNVAVGSVGVDHTTEPMFGFISCRGATTVAVVATPALISSAHAAKHP